MNSIYFFCFLLFPFCIFYKAVIVKQPQSVILCKDDTDVLRGIAACSVMIAHLTQYIIDDGIGVAVGLKIYTVFGGIGVLIFFFLSGYGIFKAYAHKKPTFNFVILRIVSIYIPYIIMKSFFVVITYRNYTAKKMVLEIFGVGEWFIDVILIQYLIFYVIWKKGGGKNNKLVRDMFIVTFLVACLLWKLGFAARWYNGIMLFPVGAWIAQKEIEFCRLLNSKKIICLVGSALAFIVTGVFFTMYKGTVIADMIKTVSGVFLCVFICAVFRVIELRSPIMQYIGKRSLFYYIVHLNIWQIMKGVPQVGVISQFYIIIFLTVSMSEVFYQISRGLKMLWLKRRSS